MIMTHVEIPSVQVIYKKWNHIQAAILSPFNFASNHQRSKATLGLLMCINWSYANRLQQKKMDSSKWGFKPLVNTINCETFIVVLMREAKCMNYTFELIKQLKP